MTSGGRIGLAALFLDPGVSGGAETYLRNLVPALVSLRPDLRFELATTRRGAAALAAEPWAEEVTLLRLPCDDDQAIRRTLWEAAGLSAMARRRGWRLMHSLSNRGPRTMPCAHVITIHDVIFFHHATMGWISDRGMRWVVRRAGRGADAVIAVSEVAADDIALTLGIDRQRVTPIAHGAGRTAAGGPPVEGAAARYGLTGGRVVLCVAAKRPHKNQALLVEALARLPGDVVLVLAGHDEGYGVELESRARAAGVWDRVRLLEYVPDDELEALWSLAACAAFPTRAEGFGLPVLEAMQRGVPVACSDIPVLRQVAGDAARYFDPHSAGEAADAISACLDDPGTATRGRERAAQFSWTRSAEETLAVYERVLADRGNAS